MSNQKIRWGIIGPGNIAGSFATGLQAAENAELVAIASQTPGKAEEFGKRFNVPKRYTSYDAAVADPDVDIFYVATPHNFHKEQTLLALKAGKHVLCEKPFALSEREAQEMIACAKDKKRFVMEGMWTHCFPAMAKVRELLAAKAIGEVRMVQASFCFQADFNPESRLFNPKLAGGALLDVGVYTIGFSHMVYDAEPTAVTSLAEMAPSGVDSRTGMVLKYPGGGMAVLDTAVSINTSHEARIYGSKGSIVIPANFWCPTRIVVNREGQPTEELSFEQAKGNGFTYEADEVAHCLRKGLLESTVVPHSRTLAVARTMDRVRAAWGKGVS